MRLRQPKKFSWILFLILATMTIPADMLAMAAETALFEIVRFVQKLCALGVLLLSVRRYLETRKLPLYVLLFGFLEIWIVVVTLIKSGPDYAYGFLLNNALQIGALALAVYAFSDSPDTLVYTSLICFEWLIFANLLSQLICGENGILRDMEYNDAQFFLGHKNQFIGYAYPAVFSAVLTLKKDKNTASRVNAGLTVLASYTTVFISDSSSSKAGLLLSTALFLVLLYPKWRKILVAPFTFGFAFLCNLLLVVCRVGENVPIIAGFIEKVLHRKVTFTGRTGIWDNFLSQMPGKWLTGLGYKPGKLLTIDGRTVPHAHNQYYEFVSEGGLIALAVFLIVLALISLRLTRNKDSFAARTMTAIITGLMFVFICEPIYYPVYILYMFALNIHIFND